MSGYRFVPYSSGSVMAGRVVLGDGGLGIPFGHQHPCACCKKRWTPFSIFVLMLFIIVAALILKVAIAANLGTFGKTYPIAENNLIEVIKTKAGHLSTAELTFHSSFDVTLDNQFQQKQSGVWLPGAMGSRTRFLDLTQRLSKDVVTPMGRVIAKQGTAVNPLSLVHLTTPLLFIDGSDEEHLAWAKHEIQQVPNSLVILVHGNPLTLRKQWRREVYFDQGGKLSQRFELSVVPSKVTQAGLQLKIEEVAL